MNLSPRVRRWLRAPFTCAFAASLMACGDGQSSGAQPAGESLESAVARLEASGQLPVLDRTDSLAGIDANANGVRDDIERHIERKYTEPAQRKVAMQTARALQKKLFENSNDAAALDAVSAMGMRAANCRGSVFPGPDDGPASWQMVTDLESMTTNTKKRLLAYLAYNKARSGSVSTLPKGDTCE
jgi:hypothetical protein